MKPASIEEARLAAVKFRAHAASGLPPGQAMKIALNDFLERRAADIVTKPQARESERENHG